MALTYRTGSGGKDSALTIEELDNNFRHFTGSHSITGSLTISGSCDITGSLNVSGSITTTEDVNLTGSFTGSFTGTVLDLKQTDVTITPAQMLSLNGGGTVEILPSPGAGKLLVLMDVMYYTDFNSVAYNFSGGLGEVITFFIGSTNLNSALGFVQLNTLSDAYYIKDPLTASGEVFPNSNLSIQSTSGVTVSQGDSPIKFSILYREIEVS